MQTTNNIVIDKFIIDKTIIDPLSKIIKQLNEGEFRDCDISWLNNKLYNFMDFAGVTLGIRIGRDDPNFDKFNDYVTTYYLEKFEGLLKYFKSF